MSTPRIPLNLFAIPFGLAGLAGSWLIVTHYGHAPVAIGDGLLALSALTWLVVLISYARYVSSQPSVFARDLTDAMAGPFASLAVITPMILAAEGIYPHGAGTGRLLLDVFLVLTVLLGAWFTGQWIYGPLEVDQFHPGYFLPTVAGGLIASAGAAEVGQRRLAEIMLGLGALCWAALGSIILGRLLFRPLLPKPLLPTLAIEIAPAAVGSLAYFALNGDHVDAVAAIVGGYGLLMVLAQLRLLPLYISLPFAAGTWAFAFSWAAVATTGLHWLNDQQPSGYRIYEYVLLGAITTLVGGIAVRTIVAVARRQLLPAGAVVARSTVQPEPAPIDRSRA
ncbi:SLAC1 family transporter [Jatrophihabitans sp. DSM 45814]